MKPAAFGNHWQFPGELSLQVIEVRHSIRVQFTGSKKAYFPFWVLDYDFIGTTGYRLGNERKWKTRGINTAHLYPPNTVYWEKENPELTHLQSAWCLFTGNIEANLRKYTQDQGYAVFRDPENIIGKSITKAARIAAKETEEAAAKYWQTTAQVLKMLSNLNKATHVEGEYWQLSHKHKSHKEQLVEAAQKFISENLNNHISIDDIAAHLEISSSTLSHHYRDITGKTPIQALLEARIDEAKSLLIQGHKLKYIAQNTGFYDEYHLAKTFKKLTGTTPGKFRTAILKSIDAKS